MIAQLLMHISVLTSYFQAKPGSTLFLSVVLSWLVVKHANRSEMMMRIRIIVADVTETLMHEKTVQEEKLD